MASYGAAPKARHGRDFYLYLAAALVTLRMLIRRATRRYRWDGRPTTRRLSNPTAGRSKSVRQ
jgi:hypothetical protein